MTPKTITLPIARGILEHKDRMGPAIWEFLWFVDKVTQDIPDGAGNFHGIVLAGRPVSLQQIANDLKEHPATAKRNVRALEIRGYILRQRRPENRCAYVVTNSKKWFWKDHREGENTPTHEGENAPADVTARAEMHPPRGHKCTHREGINAPANKETLQDTTKNTTKSKTNTAPSGAVALPDWMPSENWEGFLDHRKRLRAPLTPRAIKLIVNKLASLRARGYSPAEVLDQSVEQGWKGIFELKGNGNGNRAQQQQDSNIEAGRKAVEILKRRRQEREDNAATDSSGSGVQGDVDTGVHGHLFGKPV